MKKNTVKKTAKVKAKKSVATVKRRSTKKSAKALRITDEIRQSLRKSAEELVNKPNIKRYGFSADKVEKMLVHLYKTRKGKFDLKNEYKFSGGYCDENDNDFNEINAIIGLMKKHRPNEMVLSYLSKGKKVLIVGDAAKELFEKSKVDWNEAHVTSAGAKIPIKLPLKSKLKCFGGETIAEAIDKNIKGKKRN